MKTKLIYEDDFIMVCHKPAGIATQTAKLGQMDVVSELKNYLTDQTGVRSPWLGLVHRLDQPVEGLLVFAKTRQAAAGLSRQLAGNEAEKTYAAAVFGGPDRQKGILTDHIKKGGATNTAVVVSAEDPDGKEAKLAYEVIQQQGEITFLRVRLFTGRLHQIRLQLLHAGFPILGDAKYGTAKSRQYAEACGIRAIALCAYRLAFLHPVTGEQMVYHTRPENKVFENLSLQPGKD